MGGGRGSETRVGKMGTEQVRGGEAERLVWVPDCLEPCEPRKQQTNLPWGGSEDSRKVIGGFEEGEFQKHSEVSLSEDRPGTGGPFLVTK